MLSSNCSHSSLYFWITSLHCFIVYRVAYDSKFIMSNLSTSLRVWVNSTSYLARMDWICFTSLRFCIAALALSRPEVYTYSSSSVLSMIIILELSKTSLPSTSTPSSSSFWFSGFWCLYLCYKFLIRSPMLKLAYALMPSRSIALTPLGGEAATLICLGEYLSLPLLVFKRVYCCYFYSILPIS